MGRVWPRHGHRGRPLNSVVRRHFRQRTMGHAIYDALGIGLSIVVGILLLGGMVVSSRRDPAFMRQRYWRWFGYASAWCVASPFMYQWGAPHSISLADAALLRVREAGWTYSLMSYAGMVGVLVGGVVGAFVSGRGQPNDA